MDQLLRPGHLWGTLRLRWSGRVTSGCLKPATAQWRVGEECASPLRLDSDGSSSDEVDT